MGISAIAFTEKGMELGRLLQSGANDEFELSRCAEGELFSWTRANFTTGNALLFICPPETAIRAIAPFLRNDVLDPAVVVLDDLGRFATPLLSGHFKGANALAGAIAEFTGGTAVLTFADDIENMFAVDAWAKSVGLRIANPECSKHISAKLLAGGSVKYDSVFPITGVTPEGIEKCSSEDDCDFVITYLSSVADKTLHLVPPVLTLGVGCISDVPAQIIEAAFDNFMQECGCHPLAIRELCTINGNALEKGLLEFCTAHELSFRCFSASELSQLSGDFTVSGPDGQISQEGSVCERSAVLGSGGGTLLVRKTIFNGITMALAIKEPGAAEEERT